MTILEIKVNDFEIIFIFNESSTEIRLAFAYVSIDFVKILGFSLDLVIAFDCGTAHFLTLTAYPMKHLQEKLREMSGNCLRRCAVRQIEMWQIH